MDKQIAVIKMKQAIERAAALYGLNLTVYQGKIGFVDQKQRKIIALWEPKYSLRDAGTDPVCTATGQECSMCQPGPCDSRKEDKWQSN